MKRTHRGGFALGLIIGLLLGLVLALGVALYVTKVPVPFVNKVPPRTAEQDAAEAERNKNWNPNAPLAGKPPVVVPPPSPPASPAAPTSMPPAPAMPPVATTPRPAAPAPQAPRDPAAILAGKSPAPAASANPASDPFTYWVQVGAYQNGDEAEQQRARLAMLGYSARITEREQSGRTIYRVRVGPFERKEDADSTKSRLDGSGVDSALVRVQK